MNTVELRALCDKYGYGVRRLNRLNEWLFKVGAAEAPVFDRGTMRLSLIEKKFTRSINPIIRILWIVGFPVVLLLDAQGIDPFLSGAIVYCLAAGLMLVRSGFQRSIARLLEGNAIELAKRWSAEVPELSEEELSYLYYVATRNDLQYGVVVHKLEGMYQVLSQWSLWRARNIHKVFEA